MSSLSPAHKPPCFLPEGFEHEIGRFSSFFSELRAAALEDEVPRPDQSAMLADYFERFWTLAGRDASLGLSEATPDHRVLREALGPFLYESSHIAYCLNKPRGYAGDYNMMEAICDREPVSKSPLGRWLDRWFFEQFPPYISVRLRVAILADILRSERRRGAGRVLSVACGAAPELRRLAPHELPDHVDLLDQDIGALEHALNRLETSLGNSSHPRLSKNPSRIKDLLQEPSLLSGPYDVIYSMGLYDYLDRRTAQRLTHALWSRLAPGGLLVVGNYNGHHWARYVMEAVMDWFLVYRDPDELLVLAPDHPDVAEARVVQDDTGLLQLLQVRRRSSCATDHPGSPATLCDS